VQRATLSPDVPESPKVTADGQVEVIVFGQLKVLISEKLSLG